MVTIHCPSCGKSLTVPMVEGVTLRWNSIECKNCHATVAVHINCGCIYFKWEASKVQLKKTPLWEELQII